MSKKRKEDCIKSFPKAFIFGNPEVMRLDLSTYPYFEIGLHREQYFLGWPALEHQQKLQGNKLLPARSSCLGVPC